MPRAHTLQKVRQRQQLQGAVCFKQSAVLNCTMIQRISAASSTVDKKQSRFAPMTPSDEMKTCGQQPALPVASTSSTSGFRYANTAYEGQHSMVQ